MMRYRIGILLLLLFCGLTGLSAQSYQRIKKLHWQDPVFKSLSLEIAKWGTEFNFRRAYSPDEVFRIENFPELKITTYRLERGITLKDVAKKLSLREDTLISLNNIANELSIEEGQDIFIPNMDGIILISKTSNSLQNVADEYNLNCYALGRLNNKSSLSVVVNEQLFIPYARLSKEEKSYYQGTIFRLPLPEDKSWDISSKHGYRTDPFTSKLTYHGGIDIPAKSGTSVYPTLPGLVAFAGEKGGYGNLVILKHPYGYTSFYGHLSAILVKAGQKVATNTLIGLVGSTGRSTGPHLHFEIRRFDERKNPLDFLSYFSHQ